MSQWFLEFFRSDSAPAWVQAVGSVVAILAAVAVPAWQRRTARQDAEAERARQEAEHVRRLIAGLRAEINSAIEAAGRQQVAVEGALAAAERAAQNGAKILDRGPIPLGSMMITDAAIYRQIASEIGKLPVGLIREVVRFYTLAHEIERLAEGAPSGHRAYTLIVGLLPRMSMHGMMLTKMLDKFESAKLSSDANLALTREEMLGLAKQAGYPIEAVMRERGLAP